MIRATLFGVLGWALTLLSFQAFGIDNYCSERSYSSWGRASFFCPGYTIPASKTRNFISEYLMASSGSDPHIRKPQSFDEEEWDDTRALNEQEARQQLRSMPVPEWDGVVNYQTKLHWSWEECVYRPDAYHCGTYEECTTKEHADGETYEECHDEAKSCYFDEEVHETAFCSMEKFDYHVEYARTDEADLDAENSSFVGRLANGYDLLPGEHETVTVNNGIGFFEGSTLYPGVSFDEQRNDYEVSRLTGGGYAAGSLPCRKGADDKVGFVIKAKKRRISRSGNAFTLPVDHEGNAIEPLVWQGAEGEDGDEKGYPVFMLAQDTSAVALKDVALDKNELFKNIVVKVELYEDSIFHPFVQSSVYVDEGRGVEPSPNAFSDDQAIRRSDLWNIPLENGRTPRENLYRSHIPWFLYYPLRFFNVPEETLSYDSHLRPGSGYKLKLTVYQKGLSYYYQSCDDDPDAFDCQWYAGWGWLSPKRYESNLFSSNSTDVPFTADESVNLRTWTETFWDAVNLSGNLGIFAGTFFGVAKLFMYMTM